MGVSTKWNTQKRKDLEYLLGVKAFRLPELEEAFQTNRQTLLQELKRGLSEENYKNRRYALYSGSMAAYNEAIAVLGTDGVEYALEYKNGNI